MQLALITPTEDAMEAHLYFIKLHTCAVSMAPSVLIWLSVEPMLLWGGTSGMCPSSLMVKYEVWA